METSTAYLIDGEVQEWLNWTVSKTVVPATVPRVRIPPSPPRNERGWSQ